MNWVSSILTLLFTVLFAAMTMGFTLMYSFTNSADTASSMVVMTGHRTRDWSAPNAYSMHSLNEDHHTRLYACMMQAGIRKDNFRSTLQDFRQDAKAHFNCGPQSDMGWPRDYGFLRCLQNNDFGVTYHKGNLFLKCLDLSEGVMVESLQSRDSALFLGSYNFVALQMASLGVITAFLIFTAGGAWGDDEIQKSNNNHITGVWRPVSIYNINYALAWSLFMLGSSMFYTFPVNNTWSDIPAVDDRNAFPTTPWGGYFCSMVFLAMTAFFFSYFMQWYSETIGFCDSNKSEDNDKSRISTVTKNDNRSTRASTVSLDDTRASGKMSQRSSSQALPTIPTVSSIKRSRSIEGNRFSGPSSAILRYNPPSRNGSFTRPEDQNSASSFNDGQIPNTDSASSNNPYSGEYSAQNSFSQYAPAQNSFADNSFSDISPGSMYSTDNRSSSSFRTKFYKPLPNKYLGINADLYQFNAINDKSTESELLPFINKAFACTWVFSDSLLFVGMLNSQNSMLTENVVTVCYYIFLCRAFQLAGTYFMDNVIYEPDLIEIDNADNGSSSKVEYRPKTHESNIVAACCQLCSFWCYAVVLMHFLNSFYLAYSLQMLSIGNQTYAAQLTFVIIMTIMELVKHSLVFYAVLFKVSSLQYAMASKIIFLVDCVARAVFIITTTMVVSHHLGALNVLLFDDLKTA